MFKRRTVFIIGAGASAEVSMPVGGALVKSISDKLNYLATARIYNENDVAFGQLLLQLGMPYNEQRPLFDHMASAMRGAASIDNYLHARKDDPKIVIVGKLCIAEQLVDAEARSALAAENPEKDYAFSDTISKSWLRCFFHVLVSKVNLENIDEIFSKVSFVSFNYDRCIKQYLYYALKGYYGLTDSRTSEIVRKLPVIHPYGSLGKLPWECDPGEHFSVPYGRLMPTHAMHYDQISKGIYTFDESIADIDNVKSAIRALIDPADQMIFLGFAYHEQNLDLLSSRGVGSSRPIFGSAYGLSGPTTSFVQNRLANIYNSANSVQLTPRSAAGLFDEFGAGMLGG